MSRQTNNSVHAALFSGETDIPPLTTEPHLSVGIPRSITPRPSDLGMVASGSTAPTISPELLAVITHTKHAAMAAEREKDRPALTSTSPSSSVTPSTGGVPASLQLTAANIMALGNPLALG